MHSSDADRFVTAVDTARDTERHIEALQAAQRDAFTAWQQTAHDLAAAERADRAADYADAARTTAELHRAQGAEQSARATRDHAQIELNTALQQWREQERAAARGLGLEL